MSTAASSYDVVVIGAGPAGSVCARRLAERGYRVLLAEKRPVVGVPVRCGEATGTRADLAEFTEVNEDYIETTIRGAILHAPDGTTIRYDHPSEIAVMLDRALFDQDLARRAASAGAEVRVNARIAGIGEAGGGAREVTLIDDTTGEESRLRATLVVGADGAEALSGRWVGLKTRQLPPHTCTGIEFRVDAMDSNPEHLTFWAGNESLAKGYLWVFPKVKSRVVNLGCGALIPKLGHKTMFDISQELKEKLFPGAKVLEVHGGAVPVSGFMDEYVADRFLLCGDAARHTDPLTGGGIMVGMLAATIAAEWVDKALKAGDCSRAFLLGYQRACWKRFGRDHGRELKLREFILNLPGDGQARFYRILKSMVDAKFRKRSLALGGLKLLTLAAANWKTTRKALAA